MKNKLDAHVNTDKTKYITIEGSLMKVVFLFLFIAAFAPAFSQTVYEPQVLILTPYEVKYDKSFQHEIDSLNVDIKSDINPEEIKARFEESKTQDYPENVRRMMKGTVELILNIDIFKHISGTIQQSMMTKISYALPELLIAVQDTTLRGNAIDLQNLAKREGFQYVLNIPAIELYKENNMKFAKMRIQLYDDSSAAIIIEKTYIGDWYSPNFEFSCPDSSIRATLNNVIQQTSEEILLTVINNMPRVKKAKKLEEERGKVLMSNYYDLPFDKTFLSRVISKTDSNVDVNYVYQLFSNQDSTRFVAFVLQPMPAEESQELFGEEKEEVEVNPHRQKLKEMFREDMPRSDAYILIGSKNNGKWRYEKREETAFPTTSPDVDKKEYFKSIQRINFFKEDSTELNPDFWNSEDFKILDEYEDPDKD